MNRHRERQRCIPPQARKPYRLLCGTRGVKGCNWLNWFRSVLLSLAMVLAGCAIAPQKPEELAATHGFVQVVIPQFGPTAQLAVRSVTDTSSYQLHELPKGDGTLRGLWLPPGRYKLARWVQSGIADSPVFEVRARRLTNLGTLVPVALGGKEMALLPVQDAESARLARASSQRLRPYLAEGDALSWEAIDVPKPFVIDPGYSGLGLVADLLVLYDQHVNQAPIAKRLRQSKTPGEMLALAKEAAAPQTREPAVALYVSANGGETWTAHDAPSLIIDDIVFDSPDHGIVARWPMAAFKSRVVFETYGGTSNTWVPRDPGPEACRLILQDARKLPNFCVTGSGSVLFHSEKGWGVEFSAE